MKQRITIIVATVVLAAVPALGAQSQGREHPQVAGTWNVTVKGPAAHGDMPATMLLQQDGAKVTGSFSAHGNEHSVKGEFAEGTLTLETTDTPSDKALTFTAKLKDDGTLAGYLSSPMGDMQWTASRAKDGQ